MTTSFDLACDREHLETVCRRHGVRRLSLFGSVARGEASDESDVDVLVEFSDGADVDLWSLAGLQADLADLLGRHVDLTTPTILSRYIRRRVLADAVPLYVSG